MTAKHALKISLDSSRDYLQVLGEILITPAAILPLAGLLLMAGDLTGKVGFIGAGVLVQVGAVLLQQFPLLAAASLAFGLANGQSGAAALSGVLSYLAMSQAGSAFMSVFASDAYSFDMGLLTGVLAGITASLFHNRFRALNLPEFLKFFSGARLPAMFSVIASAIVGSGFGLLWTVVQPAVVQLADLTAATGAGGAFAYGTLSRLLMPFGLNVTINQEIWTGIGEFTSRTGQLVTGDLNRFLAGDPTAGRLTAGFYPMMIFGVPAVAACLIMTARTSARIRLMLMMAIAAVTSLVSGITEPLEYMILFVSPILYVLYALLYGLSLLLAYQLQVLIGFGFSSGLVDYLKFWDQATHPERVWQIGIVMGILSLTVTYFAVRLLRLRAPGQDRPEAEDENA